MSLEVHHTSFDFTEGTMANHIVLFAVRVLFELEPSVSITALTYSVRMMEWMLAAV